MVDIILYPDPRLRKVASPVEIIDNGIKEISQQMIEVLEKQAGAGLAGPQIGFPYKIIVVTLTRRQETPSPEPIVMINPEIISTGTGEKVVEEEGCLSLPGLVVKIPRYENIEVRFLSIDNKLNQLKASGFGARVIQHEIDHLDGILIVDRMSHAEKIANAEILRKLEMSL